MKKSTNAALIVMVLLVVAFLPLYIYTRPVSTEPDIIQLTGKVGSPMNLTLSQLKTYTPVTMTVTVASSGHTAGNGVFNYTGVLLRTLLDQAQAAGDASSVYIQAPDGYGATITMQEATSQYTFIAYEKEGEPLSNLKDGGEGPARLIINTDQYAQRWVRGVASIIIS